MTSFLENHCHSTELRMALVKFLHIPGIHSLGAMADHSERCFRMSHQSVWLFLWLSVYQWGKELCAVMAEVLSCVFLFHDNQLIHLTNKALWKLLNQELPEEILNFSGVHILCIYIHTCRNSIFSVLKIVDPWACCTGIFRVVFI